MELGKLGRGIPKKLTPAERKRRRQWMERARRRLGQTAQEPSRQRSAKRVDNAWQPSAENVGRKNMERKPSQLQAERLRDPDFAVVGVPATERPNS